MSKESTANRGLDWEKKISNRLEQYRNDGIAVIHKVPTEFKLIRNKYSHKIVNAFPVSESKFVDYVGVFASKAIAIEAKRTTNKTSFPFSNIKDSQYTFFDDWIDCGGLGYYLIWFKTLDLAYWIHADKIRNARDTLDRKSIPLDWFKENAIQLDKNLNFLECIENNK